jgi:hypothetical protein
LEEIIISSYEVFKEFIWDMGVEIRMMGIPTRETAENNDTAKQPMVS